MEPIILFCVAPIAMSMCEYFYNFGTNHLVTKKWTIFKKCLCFDMGNYAEVCVLRVQYIGHKVITSVKSRLL